MLLLSFRIRFVVRWAGVWPLLSLLASMKFDHTTVKRGMYRCLTHISATIANAKLASRTKETCLGNLQRITKLGNSRNRILEVAGTVQDIEHTLPLLVPFNSSRCKTTPRLLVCLALVVGLGNVVEDALLLGRRAVNDLTGLERCPLVSV